MVDETGAVVVVPGGRTVVVDETGAVVVVPGGRTVVVDETSAWTSWQSMHEAGRAACSPGFGAWQSEQVLRSACSLCEGKWHCAQAASPCVTRSRYSWAPGAVEPCWGSETAMPTTTVSKRKRRVPPKTIPALAQRRASPRTTRPRVE